MSALNDPDKKSETLKSLLERVQIIEDEKGNKQEIVSIGGLYLDAKIIRFPKRMLSDTKNMSLRDDDTILATSPKTGTVLLLSRHSVSKALN